MPGLLLFCVLLFCVERFEAPDVDVDDEPAPFCLGPREKNSVSFLCWFPSFLHLGMVTICSPELERHTRVSFGGPDGSLLAMLFPLVTELP